MGLDTISPFTTNKDWIRNTPYRAWHWKERTIQSDAEYAALIWSMDENVGKVLLLLISRYGEEKAGCMKAGYGYPILLRLLI